MGGGAAAQQQLRALGWAAVEGTGAGTQIQRHRARVGGGAVVEAEMEAEVAMLGGTRTDAPRRLAAIRRLHLGATGETAAIVTDLGIRGEATEAIEATEATEATDGLFRGRGALDGGIRGIEILGLISCLSTMLHRHVPCAVNLKNYASDMRKINTQLITCLLEVSS